MSKFRKGDNVVAAKDIGGVIRDQVPAGTQGVVVEGPIWGEARVQFTVDGFWGRRTAVVGVSDEEIR